jgi:protoheme ferro-lyase
MISLMNDAVKRIAAKFPQKVYVIDVYALRQSEYFEGDALHCHYSHSCLAIADAIVESIGLMREDQ